MIFSMLTQYLNELTDSKNHSDSECIEFGPTNNLHEKIVKKILLTMDPSIDALNYARTKKANVILTYNPLLSLNSSVSSENLPTKGKMKTFNIDESLIDKLLLINQNHMIIYNFNKDDRWDAAEMGSSSTLAHHLGIETNEDFGHNLKYDSLLQENISCNPGRIGQLKSINKTLESFLVDIKRNLRVNTLQYSIFNQNPLEKIAIWVGSCNNQELVRLIHEKGCTLLLVGQINHNCLTLAQDYHISVVQTTVVSNIRPGLEKIMNLLTAEFPQIDIELFEPNEILKLHS